MSETILKKFGRYILLDRVAQGGMAEIFRARSSAADGGGRILVIKRIQSNYRSNKEFLEMFKAEIKLTMGFNHPNIVQLHDYGDSQGTPYIAMEYVDGKTVRQFAGRFFKKKEMLPIDLVLSIVEQAARGLAYAHGFRDKMSGDELHIVHRDISPQNIIISYDGVVKLIDFGIAKARTSANLTRTGIIKGKPSYMAPEQVHGEDLDGRSDIFSLGIVLWELLTGKKLFSTTGKSEYTVLKMIEACDKIVKPPSVLNPDIKPELDQIVLKALAKDRKERYQSATELQRALQKYLVLNYPEHNISEIPYWMDRLFGEDKAEDQKRVRELNYKAEEIIGEAPELTDDEVNSEVLDAVTERNGNPPRDAGKKAPDTLGQVLVKDIRGAAHIDHSKSGSKPQSGNTGEQLAPHGMQDFELEQMGTSVRVGARSTTPRADRERAGARFQVPVRKYGKRTAGIAAAVAVLTLMIVPDLLTKIPFVSDVYLGGRQVLLDMQSGKLDIPVLSTMVKSMMRPRDRSIAAVKPAATPTPTPAPSNSAFMNLRISPAGLGTKITINGQTMWTPVPVIELPIGIPITLEVERTGFKPFKKELGLTPNMFKNSREYQLDVSLDPEVFGFLSVRGNLSSEIYVREIQSSSKAVSQDSSTWYFKSRFDLQKFPPGTYLVQLTNRGLELEAVETVRVEKGLISRVSAELAPASNLTERSPDKIVGLVGWFRAGAISGLREHDVVDSWNDSSKNLNQFYQKDPVHRPGYLSSEANGQPVLTFDGRGSGMESETLASRLRGVKTLTVIYVVRVQSTLMPQTVMGCYARNGSKTIFEVAFDPQSKILVRENEGSFVSANRAIASVGTSAAKTGYGIYSAVLTGNSVIVHENGVRRVTEQGTEIDFANTAICSMGRGWTYNQSRDFLNGNLGEVLVYDHALSVREQESIERYLSQSYKIPLGN